MGIKRMGMEGRGGYGRERRMRGIEGRIQGNGWSEEVVEKDREGSGSEEVVEKDREGSGSEEENP